MAKVEIHQDAYQTVAYSVRVDAASAPVYERWNRIEEYPSFMEGVREIRWLDEKRFMLISEAVGMTFESICEVVLRIPAKRLAWRTLSGPDSSGVACFESVGAGQTEVTLKMRYDPRGGWTDEAEVKARLGRNLERFKQLVEAGSGH